MSITLKTLKNVFKIKKKKEFGNILKNTFEILEEYFKSGFNNDFGKCF